MFQWYSRPMFNAVLSQSGVGEEDCSEKQCMEALAAVSEEIRKYPLAQSELRPFAGPQCYAHLDKESAQCRVRANERNPDRGEGVEAPRCAAEELVDVDNWFQCDCCGRWRFVGRHCATALREHLHFQVRESDVDWAQDL